MSSWYKKEQLKGPRRFFFSFSTRKELYEWTMALNFLRVKAIHDDFTLKFGTIHLPLKFEVKRKTVKIIKKKFAPDTDLISEERSFRESSKTGNKDTDVIKIRQGSIEYQVPKSLLMRKATSYSRFSTVGLNFNLNFVEVITYF